MTEKLTEREVSILQFGVQQGMNNALAALTESLLSDKVWPEFRREIHQRGGSISVRMIDDKPHICIEVIRSTGREDESQELTEHQDQAPPASQDDPA